MGLKTKRAMETNPIAEAVANATPEEQAEFLTPLMDAFGVEEQVTFPQLLEAAESGEVAVQEPEDDVPGEEDLPDEEDLEDIPDDVEDEVDDETDDIPDEEDLEDLPDDGEVEDDDVEDEDEDEDEAADLSAESLAEAEVELTKAGVAMPEDPQKRYALLEDYIQNGKASIEEIISNLPSPIGAEQGATETRNAELTQQFSKRGKVDEVEQKAKEMVSQMPHPDPKKAE